MDIYRNYGEKMDFHVHDASSFEEVGEAVLVCAFAAAGHGDLTDAQREDAELTGPKLLDYANKRFGEGSSQKISAAIAVTVVMVKAALASRQNSTKTQAKGLIDEVFNG